MARIVFQVRDQEGNLVEIETSEMEFEKVLSGYPNFLHLICERGFSPIKARGNGAKQEKVKFDGKTCPACQSEMWDNRAKNAANGKKGPDFRCKNQNCSGATPDKNDATKKWPFCLWAGQYEIVS